MSEINTNGYQELRDYIQANWKYLELRDGSGNPIVRLQAGVDPRVTWTHNAGAQVLELTAVIKGSDSDIGALPRTFASSAVFKVAANGSAFSVEAFSSSFTIATVDDQLTVKHRIQVPKVS